MIDRRTEVEIPFKIDSSASMHYLKDYRPFLEEFRAENRGKRGVIIYRIDPEKTQHYQHKYYRGFLVPPFARESFSENEDEAHDFLKERFLFTAVKSYSEIPGRFKDRCNKFFTSGVNMDTGEVTRVLVGFTPSTGDLTKSEFKEFIKKVEVFIMDISGTGIDASRNSEALHYRNLALEIDPGDPDQAALFDDAKGVC